MKLNNIIDGSTRKLALIGHPVEHSLSPLIHNSFSQFLNDNYIYLAYGIKEDKLEEAVKSLRELDYIGFNVTVPYKSKIIEYLDEVDNFAREVHSVNTVKNINGKLVGYNTDAKGFLKHFKENCSQGFYNRSVLILGAGGVARSMISSIALEKPKKIVIANRTIEKAHSISNMVKKTYNYEEIDIISYDNEKIFYKNISETDIIINTTSVGMFPKIEETIVSDPKYFSNSQVVYDVVYNPKKTKLLLDAEKSGAQVINGLGMLFYQALLAYEIWLDKRLDNSVSNCIYESLDKYVIKNS